MKINLLFNTELNIYFNRLYKRQGVCSQKFNEPARHITIWDFDEASYNDIVRSLKRVQRKYNMPTIYIVTSSVNHYHAYSFTSRTLKDVIHILSDTEFICDTYLRLGMVRGYYTLRISPRKNECMLLVSRLISDKPDEMLPSEVTISEYITYNKGGQNA